MSKLYFFRVISALLVISLATMASLGFSQPVPNQSGKIKLVVDEANVFTTSQKKQLEYELEAFSDSTSNQIVVVTMKDLEGYEPFEVAYNIGKTWGVGQEGFDNGIVILFKPKTSGSRGQTFIATGYGLEGAIPDATTKMIVEREMIPRFKTGDIYGGIHQATVVLKSLAVNEYNSDAYASTSGGGTGSWFPILFILFVFIISMIGRARSARSYGVGHNVSFWTAMMLMNQSSGHGGSYGNFTSGGGGFGGFGGGGFGGGGAGGSW